MKKLLFLIFLKLALSYYISDSPCIDRPVQQNFEMEKFAGKWYTISRYANPYEGGIPCGYGTNVFINKTHSKSRGCKKTNGNLICMEAIYYVAEPDRVPLEGTLNLLLLNNTSHPLEDDFKILSTDYDNYMLTYTCKNIEDGKSKNLLWVISRKETFDKSVQPIVHDLIDKYFVHNKLIPINQDPQFCEP